jgi:hypothetical protein
MTEAEAKTKWCPMVRAGMYGERHAAMNMVAVNRDPRANDLALCIGSQCMMWQGTTRTDRATLAEIHEGHCGLARQV